MAPQWPDWVKARMASCIVKVFKGPLIFDDGAMDADVVKAYVRPLDAYSRTGAFACVVAKDGDIEKAKREAIAKLGYFLWENLER